MNKKPSLARRKYFINRKFQLEFSFRFLLIIAAASIGVMLLFFYNSRGTMTAGYSGYEVKLLQTGAYFLPSLILSTIIIVIFSCFTGAIALILLSHRFAGPLFRFQATLDELKAGNLTRRFNLRDKDQFKDLADRINALSAVMDAKMVDIKSMVAEISSIIADIRSFSASQPVLREELAAPLQVITEKLLTLQEAAGFFQTSPPK
ncbi:MAG TPA: methyl-accepting chemotaxis protein [Syntrophales bacterium]|nr:methyl-accepting chemotaxis protein [Syntrophales bacterium]